MCLFECRPQTIAPLLLPAASGVRKVTPRAAERLSDVLKTGPLNDGTVHSLHVCSLCTRLLCLWHRGGSTRAMVECGFVPLEACGARTTADLLDTEEPLQEVSPWNCVSTTTESLADDGDDDPTAPQTLDLESGKATR